MKARYGLDLLRAGWYATEGPARTRVFTIGRRSAYAALTFITLALISNLVTIHWLHTYTPPT